MLVSALSKGGNRLLSSHAALKRLIRAVETFGFHLATLDLRQNAEVHERVIAELLAVARACATNPAALVIPCHRVVREDKSLGGYRWGLARKKKLLENESGAEARHRGPRPGSPAGVGRSGRA